MSTARVPHHIGLYLAGVQFFFAVSWIVYALYLPQLAEQAGLTRKAVPWLLMMDQVVFLLCDFAVGVSSDRAAAVLGRLGRWVLGATLVSSAAFLALPWLAPQGSPGLFVAITVVWAITSSALRAPPLTLLGRYAAKPSQPWLVALSLLGLGVAGALAPFIGLQLKPLDPRVPFLLSAAALAAVTLGMVAAERSLARQAGALAVVPSGSPVLSVPPALERQRPVTAVPGFLLAAVLAALAFQVHAFVTSAPLYLRHVPASELPHLMPVFWIGFNLCMMPASLATRHFGALPVMAAGALVAAAAAALAWQAGSLALLMATQALAGAAWATLLMSAFSAALFFGHTGREGRFSGALSSVLALAALSRLALLAWQPPPQPAAAADWGWLPVLGFLAGASLLWAMWSRSRS